MIHYHLTSFGIIQITGKEYKSFLNTQFSNDILALDSNEACYATYNNPKGRVLANFIVCHLDQTILLIVKKDLIPVMLQKLILYKMRSQVTITNQSDYYNISGCIMPRKITTVPYPLKFPINNHQQSISIACPNGTQLSLYSKDTFLEHLVQDENDWNLFEIQQGFSWITQVTSEKCVAQMLNQEWLGAIHFKKGCYPGQEIIARSQYRGTVKRRPALLTSQHHYAIGHILYQNYQEVGIILNTAKTENDYIYLAIIKINTDPIYWIDKDQTTEYPLQLLQWFYYQKESN